MEYDAVVVIVAQPYLSPQKCAYLWEINNTCLGKTSVRSTPWYTRSLLLICYFAANIGEDSRLITYFILLYQEYLEARLQQNRVVLLEWRLSALSRAPSQRTAPMLVRKEITLRQYVALGSISFFVVCCQYSSVVLRVLVVALYTPEYIVVEPFVKSRT